MHDVVIRIGDSVIQHGKHNDRVYLMSLSSADRDPIDPILATMELLAVENGYSKIFCKVPAPLRGDFPVPVDMWRRHIYRVSLAIQKMPALCAGTFPGPVWRDESRAENREVLDELLAGRMRRKTMNSRRMPAAISVQ